MIRRPRIAILGCSFSAVDYSPGEKSWSYFFAKDNPNIDIVNFAISAHGFDYARFVLNWMVYTKTYPDMIIMNIPPLNRKFTWEAKGNTFDISSPKSFFNITQVENNLSIARPRSPRLLYCSSLFYEDDSRMVSTEEMQQHVKENNKSFEKHVYNTYIHMMDNHSSIYTLSSYEQVLGCKIFYYMYNKQGHWDILTNFYMTQPPQEYMPTLFPNEDIFISKDDHHLNTRGNELFYYTYIKNDPDIQSAIRNLK